MRSLPANPTPLASDTPTHATDATIPTRNSTRTAYPARKRGRDTFACGQIQL